MSKLLNYIHKWLGIPDDFDCKLNTMQDSLNRHIFITNDLIDKKIASAESRIMNTVQSLEFRVSSLEKQYEATRRGKGTAQMREILTRIIGDSDC